MESILEQHCSSYKTYSSFKFSSVSQKPVLESGTQGDSTWVYAYGGEVNRLQLRSSSCIGTGHA